MKKFFALALMVAVTGFTAVYADQVIQDFEAQTNGADPGSTWGASFSGSTAGIANPATVISNEQNNTTPSTGALSVKIGWDWSAASGGTIRIQPTTLVETGPANHSAEPHVSWAIFGANSGDLFNPYMCDTGNNAGYEKFTDSVTLNFTGWQQFSWNITTSPIVAWITGDGTLQPTCEWCGLFITQAAAASTQVLYLDDLQYSAAVKGTLAPNGADVNDWSVYN